MVSAFGVLYLPTSSRCQLRHATLYIWGNRGLADNPFYKSHWLTIDDERLNRYQSLFEWSPSSAVLYEPADIKVGHIVAELGCGPGHTAIEIANWVESEGHVHALDINTDFVAQTRAAVYREITFPLTSFVTPMELAVFVMGLTV